MFIKLVDDFQCYTAAMMIIIYDYTTHIDGERFTERLIVIQPIFNTYMLIALSTVLSSSFLPVVLRLRNNLYCVEWGVKLYSLTHCRWFLVLVVPVLVFSFYHPQ